MKTHFKILQAMRRISKPTAEYGFDKYVQRMGKSTSVQFMCKQLKVIEFRLNVT